MHTFWHGEDINLCQHDSDLVKRQGSLFSGRGLMITQLAFISLPTPTLP